MFSIICLCKTCGTCIGSFWPQGHNLNKLDRGPLGAYLPNIKALGLVVSGKKMFSLYKPL